MVVPKPQTVANTITVQLSLEEAMLIGAIVKDLGTKLVEGITNYDYFFTGIAVRAFCFHAFPYEVASTFFTVCNEFTAHATCSVEEVKSLSGQDLHQLLKHNSQMVQVFKKASFLNEEKFGLNQALSNCIQNGTLGIKKELDQCQLQLRANFEKGLQDGTVVDVDGGVEILMKKLQNLELKPVVKYEQLHVSPWTPSYNDEERHRQIIWKIKDWLYLDKDLNKPDDALVALGLVIITLNSTFVPLQRKDIVESAQLKYLTILKNYLKYKIKDHHKAVAKYSDFMGVIAMAMEAGEIQKKRLPF